MRRIKFLSPAEEEVLEIVAYYEHHEPGLGARFISELRKALVRIKTYPEAWTMLSPRVRRCRIAHFPYGVIYEVRKDVILIAALQHQHREPNSWRDRLA